MDLIREILLWVEAFRPDVPYDKRFVDLTLKDFPKRFHYMGDYQFQKIKKDLFTYGLLRTLTYEDGTPFADMTKDGHDYLDEVRDPKWFAKLKKRLNSNSPYSLEYIRKVSKPMKEAAARSMVFWFSAFINWTVGGILVFVAWLCGVIRFW